MSSDFLIQAKGLGKCFQMYDKPHERLLQSFYRGKKTFYKAHWALRDVSFKLKRSETIGIVGRNGSGKTTLLQLVCGTLLATEGSCQVKGRVAALLALGAGFNMEYTGRENIYLYASLLGLTEQEINQKYDDICEFADIGEFILQPVKKYSSGMFMRLAFAVAIHVEPEILIVDEALAVGDAAFQRKCYARLDSLKQKGMALLFVSHSISRVVDLCDRVLLLEKGSLIASGKPKSITTIYHKLLFSSSSEVNHLIKKIQREVANENGDHSNDYLDLADSVKAEGGKLKLSSTQQEAGIESHFIKGMKSKSMIVYESKGALISDISMATTLGKKVNMLCKGEKYHYSYTVSFDKKCQQVYFGMFIKSLTGVNVSGYRFPLYDHYIKVVSKGSSYRVTFSFICRLNPGVYFLNAGCKGLEDGEDVFLHRIVDALMIQVMPVVNPQSNGMVDFDIDAGFELLTN